MAPFGLAQLATVEISLFGPAVLLAIVYAGALAAGISNVVVFHGLKLLGPIRVTAFQFLVPALAVVLAAIFLGEAIRPVQVLGGAVILAGVALLRSGSLPGLGLLASRRSAR
jgi:drug/metabolite transporter (DMT)-like permease